MIDFINYWAIYIINNGGARLIQLTLFFLSLIGLTQSRLIQKIKWFFNLNFWLLFWTGILSISIIRMFLGVKQYFSSGYAIYSFLGVYSLWFFSKNFDDVKAWGISIAITLMVMGSYEFSWQFFDFIKRFMIYKIFRFPLVTFTHIYIIYTFYPILKEIVKTNEWKNNGFFMFFLGCSIVFNIAFLIYWQMFWEGIRGVPIFWPLSRIGKTLPVLASIAWIRGFKR